MTRLASALRLELTLQVRQKFLYAAVFSGLIWLAVLLPMSQHLRPVAEPYILLGDTSIIGFFFVGGSVFYEKQERTLSAVISTPLRFWEYLTAKVAVLLGVSVFVAVFVATVAHGFAYHLAPLLSGVVLGTLLMLLVGFITSLPFTCGAPTATRYSSCSCSPRSFGPAELPSSPPGSPRCWPSAMGSTWFPTTR
jgi:fluoroquinolone transport system permease protein